MIASRLIRGNAAAALIVASLSTGAALAQEVPSACVPLPTDASTPGVCAPAYKVDIVSFYFAFSPAEIEVHGTNIPTQYGTATWRDGGIFGTITNLTLDCLVVHRNINADATTPTWVYARGRTTTGTPYYLVLNAPTTYLYDPLSNTPFKFTISVNSSSGPCSAPLNGSKDETGDFRVTP